MKNLICILVSLTPKFFKMISRFKKRYIFPALALLVFFTGTAFKNDFFEIAKQIEIFTTMFKTLNMNYVDDTNPGELMDKAIKSTLAELDPYTVFFNEQDVVKFKINGTGEYTGIGALISRDNGKLIIREPYKGYAADKAGLKAGDEIIQIGDVNLIDFKEDAAELLKGARNTKVNIIYKRQNQNFNTTLTLDEVEIKAVPYFTLLENKTGYIVLAQFNKKAAKETQMALEKLKEQGAERMILDLRDNPGGFLVEAVKIVNLFVPKNELVVTTKSKSEKHTLTYKTTAEPIDTEIPLAILINESSASASEIVSGALQDLDRAIVIGNRSFGKGLVQRPIDLAYGTQLKITISRYYTPSGRCIQALDYSKKDKNGKAIKRGADEFQAFKTKKGRIVYDGGGIMPDLEVKEAKTSYVTKTLVKNMAIFNFATEFYYKNPIPTNGIPKFTEQDFNGFKQSLKKEMLTYESESEKTLRKALESAKNEKLDEAVIIQYETMIKFLEDHKKQSVDKSKAEIEQEIIAELIKRYLYREGFYEYDAKRSKEIISALQILNQPAQYNQLLNK